MSSNNTLPQSTSSDWDSMAKDYRQMTINVGRMAHNDLIDRVNATLPFSQATSVLDNGCGPGPIITEIIKRHGSELPQDCALLATDFSEGMVKEVESVKAENASDPVWQRVEAKVQDATNLKDIPDGSQSHITAGWVCFMTPDPQACLTESLRVLKDGGILGLTSWKDNQWLQCLKEASKVRPEAKLPEIVKDWADADLLKQKLESVGFREVQAADVPVTLHFQTHESLIDMMLTKLPVIKSMCEGWSEEEMNRTRELAIAKCKEYCPNAPGELYGQSLVALGRK